MRALVTSSRLPHALDLIRKLGRTGHEVIASDTFRTAPGNHSAYVTQRFVTASPRFDTPRFLNDLERILTEHPVDRLIPAFEDVFYIARHRERFAHLSDLFFPGFDLLRRLHNKAAFLDLARDLGLRTPPSLTAGNREELVAATRAFARFFARPAYSRAGVTLYTNVGPLAGAVTRDDCQPTADNPFVVQPFVQGTDICTMSIVHHGRVAAHSAYVHPLTMEHAGGIVFASIDAPETLRVAQTIAEATRYHGVISLDFRQTEDGLVLIECNPRPTSGLVVMPDEMFDAALADRSPDRVLTAPAGARRKLSFALLRNMVVEPSGTLDDIDALLHGGPDIHADPRDMMPFVYQIIAYSHVIGYRLKTLHAKRSALMQGYLYDIVWNGEALD